MITSMSALRNPYNVGRLVQGEGRFFGMLPQLAQMNSVLLRASTAQHLAVIGETRAGKSSLLAEFRARNGEALKERFCIVHLDMSSDFVRGSVNSFYAQLLGHTWEALQVQRLIGPELKSAIAAALQETRPERWRIKLQQAYRGLAQHAIGLLFILDEFDHATELFEEDPNAFKLLRSLGQSDTVTFLTASRRPIAVIERDAGISSNFAGIFTLGDVYMPLLEVGDATALCMEPAARAGLQWDARVVARVVELSGGHPFLLQGFCQRLFEEALLGMPDLASTLDRLAPSLFARLSEMMTRRLQRTGLLEPLKAIVRQGVRGVDPAQVEELTRLNYLIHTDAGAVPFSPLLRGQLLGEVATETTSPVNEVLNGWGIQVGVVNVIVEGETDQAYLEIADACHRSGGQPSLLDGMHVLPAGLGRGGGVTAAARRFVSVSQAVQGTGTRVFILLDLDANGQRISDALKAIGYQNRKEYMLLNREDSPIKKPDGEVEVEVEDLLGDRILDGFRASCPEAVEACLDFGERGRRFKWKGEFKDKMVAYVREHARSDDVQKLIVLLRTVRKNAGMDRS